MCDNEKIIVIITDHCSLNDCGQTYFGRLQVAQITAVELYGVCKKRCYFDIHRNMAFLEVDDWLFISMKKGKYVIRNRK